MVPFTIRISVAPPPPEQFFFPTPLLPPAPPPLYPPASLTTDVLLCPLLPTTTYIFKFAEKLIEPEVYPPFPGVPEPFCGLGPPCAPQHSHL